MPADRSPIPRYADSMRYGNGGGLDAAARARREAVRLQALDHLAAGESTAAVAELLQVSQRSVELWQQKVIAGGVEALESKGAAGKPCRLTGEQLLELRAALDEGPAAHGYEEDQRWTLVRIRDLIWTLFRVRYTSLSGVHGLMARIRYSWQVPTRRAAERDEELISQWRQEQWPYIKARPRRSTPGSASKTRQDKA